MIANEMHHERRRGEGEGRERDLIESNVIDLHFSWKIFTIFHSFRKCALAVCGNGERSKERGIV
jgi:hypothetical protein